MVGGKKLTAVNAGKKAGEKGSGTDVRDNNS
jgi:hypothetical protein